MILGREVALWAAAAKAGISVISLYLVSLTIDQQGALNAVVAAVLGIIVALQVKAEKAVPFLIGLVEAVLYLAVSFGWNATPDQQAVLLTLVGAIVAVWTRDRVVAPIDPEGNRV